MLPTQKVLKDKAEPNGHHFQKLEMCCSSQFFFCPMLLTVGLNILCE